MQKYKLSLLIALVWVSLGLAQETYQRAHRILHSQFPPNASDFLEEKLEDARRLRYYKAVAGSETTYRAVFKKDRLHYGMTFNSQGILTDIDFKIHQVDVPGESWDSLYSGLDRQFEKFRIRKIHQRYRVPDGQKYERILANAFQNLILPDMIYDVLLTGRTTQGKSEHEASFDATGKLLALRKVLPADYDHVLY